MIMRTEYRDELIEHIREDEAPLTERGTTPEAVLNDIDTLTALWTNYQKSVEEYDVDADFAYLDALDEVIGKPKKKPEPPVETQIVIGLKDHNGNLSQAGIAVQDLLDKFWFSDYDVQSVGISVRRGSMELKATACPNEKEYPGISLDGTNNGTNLWIANAELPNKDDTDNIRARLYAGYEGSEFDGPIALVRHNVKTVPKPAKKPPTKIVYIDTDAAQYRPWRENKPMPEHAED